MAEPAGIIGAGIPAAVFVPAAIARPMPVRRRSMLRRLAGGVVARLVDIGIVRRLLLSRYAADATLTSRRLTRALSRTTKLRAADRLARLACFRAADYLERYDDVAALGFPPAFHALFIGLFEDRVLFRPETLARALARPAAPADAVRPPARPRTATPPIGLFVSALGNQFMHEIAADIGASLRGAGAAVTLLDESAAIAERPRLSVFVAPHEFFRLGRGTAWVRDDVVARAVMLNTEQPQTKWFAAGLPFLLAGRGVIDLNAQTAAMLAAAGLPALHLTPAPHIDSTVLRENDFAHPLFRALPAAAKRPPAPQAPLAARAIDIACFAAESPHREAWLARNAGFLADYDCVIHYRRVDRGPIRSGSPDGALTRLAQHVSGHARITLNLHRDGFGLLEWHRVVRLGMASGSVVVSEPSLPHPRLTPGVHYLEEHPRQIPSLLEWLLRSDDGQRHAARIQRNAMQLLADDLTPDDTAARLTAFLRATVP